MAVRVEDCRSNDATISTASEQSRRPLGLLTVAVLIFYNVAGGPFGVEDAVSDGGPFWALLGFLVFPFVWCVPEACVTAELATMFPHNSGYVTWVTAAFGPFWGFLEGWLSWLSGVMDNAIYPVLLLQYLVQHWPQLDDEGPRVAFLVGFITFFTLLSLRGIEVVGGTAAVLSLFVLSPFVVMVVLGVPQMDVSRWAKKNSQSEVDVIELLNTLFWNLNYWDSISTVAGEADNPGKTIPKALGIAVVVVVLNYLVPLAVGIATTDQSSDWSTGYFYAVAVQVCGGQTWLGLWLLASAAVSNIGQFLAEMAADSYQLDGMADLGHIPRVFARRTRFGTPYVGILLSAAIVLLLTVVFGFKFIDLVELLNGVYCVSMIIEFAAFLTLRHRHDTTGDGPDSWRVPLPTWAMALMVTPAAFFCGLVLVLPFLKGEWLQAFVPLILIVVGAAGYWLRSWCKAEVVNGSPLLTRSTPDWGLDTSSHED